MRLFSAFVITIFININTNAQTPFEQLINAEVSFEKACRDSGIKKGFLANMDSTAVVFSKSGIDNARQYWLELPDVPGFYSWAPSYGEVSVSGTWGYTTGAVEYRDSLITAEPSYYNQYTTVWYKNSEGKWKYLVDIGNEHGPLIIDSLPREIKARKVPVKNLNENVIRNLEKQYFSLFRINSDDAIKKYYSRNFILNISKYLPIMVMDSAIKAFKPLAPKLRYEPIDIRLSPSGDMAVVYGYLLNANYRKSFIRIWRNEPTGWKIALEVAKL